MSVRLTSIAAALLVALSCTFAATASAERDERRRDEGRDDPRSGELRSRYDYRYEQRERYPREQAPMRGFPQPGIAPGQLRHDPYRHAPSGRESYRQQPAGQQPYSRQPGRFDQPYGQTQRYEPERERSRGYEPPGRPLRPVNDVVRQVEGSYGGKVVGVQQEGDHYRVRVLQRDGRVRTVTVPAR